HAKVVGKTADGTHTRNAQQGVLDKDVGIVVEERNVVRILWRVNSHHHQHTGIYRANGKPQTAGRRRQQRGGDAYPVLYIQRGHIYIGAYLEGNIQLHSAVVGAVALHV